MKWNGAVGNYQVRRRALAEQCRTLGASEPPGNQGRVSVVVSECKCRLCEAGGCWSTVKQQEVALVFNLVTQTPDIAGMVASLTESEPGVLR